MSTIDSLDATTTSAPRVLRRPRDGVRDQRWVRPALIALLLATALAYLLDLGASGNANSFYAAAVQAGTKSWKAFFFGSLDSSSFITTDKPPASIWVMALSGRIFGFSSWSMLIPQALEGVAAVALLHATVKRWFGAPAGLAAGAMLAITPVAALMFRFNNPDALLVTLLVAAAYCLVRAVEAGGTRWIVATGALVGFAFLTKLGQALLVVPAFGLVYLLAAPTSLRRRIAGLLAGLASLVVCAGWWVAIVALLPATSRPFIDGSPDNNIFNLILGYNGLQRLFGNGGGAAGGGGGGSGFSGAPGTLRLFDDLMGGQASWLLPAALLALIAGLWARRSTPRNDRPRAALLLWGGWLIVTAAVFSYSQGIIHTYYAVALAPPIAALVAIGGWQLWQHRGTLRARILAALAVAGTGGWSYVLLDRTPSWQPWVRLLVLGASAVALGALLSAALLRPFARRASLVAIGAAVIAGFAGPAAYAVQTVTSAHTGSIPSAGPSAAGYAGPGGPGIGGPRGFGGGQALFGRGAPASVRPTPTLAPPRGAPGFGGGGRFAAGGGRGAGDVSTSSALVKALESNARSYRWVAATTGSMSAASYELATGGDPVMAIGGFNNNGGELSLAQFIGHVHAGDIHYFIASGGGAPGQGSAGTSQIAAWVQSHYSAQTIGGVTVYDLAG